MENHTGSWRLFNGLAVHPSSHWFTLVDTSYADYLKFRTKLNEKAFRDLGSGL